VSRDLLRDIAGQCHNWVKNRSLTWDVPLLDAPPDARDRFCRRTYTVSPVCASSGIASPISSSFRFGAIGAVRVSDFQTDPLTGRYVSSATGSAGLESCLTSIPMRVKDYSLVLGNVLGILATWAMKLLPGLASHVVRLFVARDSIHWVRTVHRETPWLHRGKSIEHKQAARGRAKPQDVVVKSLMRKN
jgi:hypothetical protein